MKRFLLTSAFFLFLIFPAFAESETSKPILELENNRSVVRGCEAFSLKKENNDTAILLIHGLGGCPHEIRKLGEYLADYDYDTYGIRYPGHGTTDRTISNYEWLDWYKVVEQKYLDLKKKYAKVYVIGFSTGATLALRLAENQQIEKLVLLSTFIQVTHKWYYGLKPELYLDTIGKLIKEIPSEFSQTNLNDPQAKKEYVRGKRFSFTNARSALKLIEEVKSNIGKVTAPILLIHSKNDDTTDSQGSKYIFENISSKEKELIFLEKSNHIITLDYEKDLVYQKIKDFLADKKKINLKQY